jgi:hypothetical protein
VTRLRQVTVLLLAALTTGCATAAPQAISPQLEDHQRLAKPSDSVTTRAILEIVGV